METRSDRPGEVDGVAGGPVDFFVSYAGVDVDWAEWIAWVLEEAGYRTRVQVWDFGAGNHFVSEMHRAARDTARTVAVLSEAYLASAYAEAEWQAALAEDPSGRGRKLLVFRIEDCPRPGLLSQLVTVDLFGVDRAVAAGRLLAATRDERRKPAVPPTFPGALLPSAVEPRAEPAFPAPASGLWKVRRRRRRRVRRRVPGVVAGGVMVAGLVALVLATAGGGRDDPTGGAGAEAGSRFGASVATDGDGGERGGVAFAVTSPGGPALPATSLPGAPVGPDATASPGADAGTNQAVALTPPRSDSVRSAGQATASSPPAGASGTAAPTQPAPSPASSNGCQKGILSPILEPLVGSSCS